MPVITKSESLKWQVKRNLCNVMCNVSRILLILSVTAYLTGTENHTNTDYSKHLLASFVLECRLQLFLRELLEECFIRTIWLKIYVHTRLLK